MTEGERTYLIWSKRQVERAVSEFRVGNFLMAVYRMKKARVYAFDAGATEIVVMIERWLTKHGVAFK